MGWSDDPTYCSTAELTLSRELDLQQAKDAATEEERYRWLHAATATQHELARREHPGPPDPIHRSERDQ